MSEKRFKLIKPLGTRLGLTDISIKDTQKDYYYNTKEMVVDLLNRLSEENEQLEEELEESSAFIIEQRKENKTLKEENEQLRMKLKGEDYIMVSEMLSNLRKTGICDDCKNKDKPVEWYLERGFSITERVCDRYEPE